jgi:uncharacterized C2H2 Zn-finger protein
VNPSREETRVASNKRASAKDDGRLYCPLGCGADVTDVDEHECAPKDEAGSDAECPFLATSLAQHAYRPDTGTCLGCGKQGPTKAATAPATPKPQVYPCPTCNRVFANEPALARHIASEHAPEPEEAPEDTEDEQYRGCERCGELFEDEKQLVGHTLIAHLQTPEAAVKPEYRPREATAVSGPVGGITPQELAGIDAIEAIVMDVRDKAQELLRTLEALREKAG